MSRRSTGTNNRKSIKTAYGTESNLRRLDIIAVRHPSTMRGPDPLQEPGRRTQQLTSPATVSSPATPPLEQSSRIAVPVVPLRGELGRNRAFLEATPRALGDLEFNFDSRVILG